MQTAQTNNALAELFSNSDRKIQIQTNKKAFYVKNEDLHNELIRCHQTGTCSNTLGTMFLKIAQRVSYMPAFKYYNEDDRNDCVSHAASVMVENFTDFDLNAGTNAFSFFTSTAMNGLRAGWNKLKKNSEATVRFDMVLEESI